MLIATRIIRIMGDDGDVAVPVGIHMPVEDDRSWRCDFEIGWPHGPLASRAYGVDAVQALQLAMLAIGTYLWANPYHHAGLLVWFDDQPDYGFPSALAPEVGREKQHRAD